MKAVVIEKYGGIEQLVGREVPDPGKPSGHDVLVRVKACSVNPIDIKVRLKVYDDYPDYYDRVPKDDYQVLGYDGAGIVEAVGDQVSNFKVGDEVYYAGSPIRHGSNAELQLVDSRSIAKKPSSLDYVQAASMPLTWITAMGALVERLEIQKEEQTAILIVNGAGGVGSVASQIAREMLKLPAVITTASSPETAEFSKRMKATHTVNHRGDIPSQVEKLQLQVPLKYVFLTHSTKDYLPVATKICAPFGKISSIVQTKEFPQYGTEMMAKSLTFAWTLLGTKPYYHVNVESHGKMLEELSQLLDNGQTSCHHQQTLPLTVEGLMKAHEKIESGGTIGKIGLSVEHQDAGSRAFM